MPQEITLNNNAFNRLIICYFRYCLSRPDLNAMECAGDLTTYWPHINVGFHSQIHRDIEQAIEHGKAGDHDSVGYWEKVLDLKK